MLQVDNLHKTYITDDGRQVAAVRGVNFTVDKGEVYTMLGPSGCGKSTILRCIAGLEKPEVGEIRIADKVVFSSSGGISVPPNQRDIGMVFQSYAIWPHMSIFDNVAFALVHGKKRHSRTEVRDLVNQALKLVDLGDIDPKRSAALVSGGQQQRIALARALVYRPSLVLLDEPLSNLDARLRDEVRKEIKEMVKSLRLTAIYVTHDQVEALSLSDRIAVLRDGVIVQEASPRDIYLSPTTKFVSRFVGNANQIEGTLVDVDKGGVGLVETSVGRLQGKCSPAMAKGDKVVFALRPEAVTVFTSRPDAETNVVEARVERMTLTGPFAECLVRCGDTALEVKVGSEVNLESRQKVYLYFVPKLCLVLPLSE